MDLLPPPPATRDLERTVIQVFSEMESGFYYWKPVVSSIHSSWLGISVEDFTPHQRSWVFDIIDIGVDSEIPLALHVEPDVISVSVFDSIRPSIRGRVLLDYRGGPRDIYIPKSLIPPKPWELDLSLTWSSEAIAEMLMAWMQHHVRRDDIYLLAYSSPNVEQSYSIGSGISISDSYMDYALSIDLIDSSMIFSVLTNISEFINQQL